MTDSELKTVDLKLSEAMHKSLQEHAERAGIPLEHFVQAYLYLSVRMPTMQSDDVLTEGDEYV